MALASRERLETALATADWIIKDAARALGVSRQAIYDAMERHGIERRPHSPEQWSRIMRERAGRPKRRAGVA